MKLFAIAVLFEHHVGLFADAHSDIHSRKLSKLSAAESLSEVSTSSGEKLEALDGETTAKIKMASGSALEVSVAAATRSTSHFSKHFGLKLLKPPSGFDNLSTIK